MSTAIAPTSPDPSVAAHETSTRTAELSRAFERLLGRNWTRDNRVRVLRNGDEFFPAMLTAIDAARREIAFVTFVWWTGDISRRFAQALARAASRGVRVTAVLDGVGSDPIPEEALAQMLQAGVEVRWYHPKRAWWQRNINRRTHRKILVVDREIGFTGGVGISHQWTGDGRHEGAWRDDQFEIRGPAVVALWATFGHSYAVSARALPPAWLEESPATDASGSSGDAPIASGSRDRPAKTFSVPLMIARTNSGEEVNEVGMALHGMLEAARSHVRIQTAYFMPRPSICQVLQARLAAGVRVQILLPGPHHDQDLVAVANDDVLIDLIEAGAEVYRYQPSMMHAKVINVDGALCAFGSANLNHRSFGRDEELMFLALSAELSAELADDFDEDLALARRVPREELRRRGWPRRLVSWFVQLFRREL